METRYRPREYGAAVRNALGDLPVVVVTGLRQAGKSTFLQKEPGLQRRRYLTLDDLETLEAARRDPEGLVARAEALTIDEVQRASDLLLAIKREVDRDRQPGRFLLLQQAHRELDRELQQIEDEAANEGDRDKHASKRYEVEVKHYEKIAKIEKRYAETRRQLLGTDKRSGERGGDSREHRHKKR